MTEISREKKALLKKLDKLPMDAVLRADIEEGVRHLSDEEAKRQSEKLGDALGRLSTAEEEEILRKRLSQATLQHRSTTS